MFDFKLIYQSIPSMLEGAWLTLELAFFSMSMGLVLGTMLGVFYVSGPKWVQRLIFGFVSFFRGTPLLSQILFAYYVLPQFQIMISPFTAVILAMGLNSSAYVSQIIAAGIKAVPKGQIEAAKCLGLNSWDQVSCIILPQAFRIVLPALGNELATMIKETSLASVIGVMELSKQGSIIRSRTYDAFSILFLMTCMYLVMTVTVSALVKRLEKRLEHQFSR